MRDLDPRFQPYARALYRVAEQYGLRPRVTSTRRSCAHQRKLYADFRAGKRNLPAAPPGRSLHNAGLAFDMVSHVPGAQEWLGAVWTSWGGSWGGQSDPVHFGAFSRLPPGEWC